ncbi:MAG: hypothetical protein JST33_07165 [Actinobacteria bacterium]|nr:hypothetical protein [Actinomycetota bacterium]
MSARPTRILALVALVVGPLTLIVTNLAQWLLQPAGADPTAADAAAQFPQVWLVVGLLAVFGPLIWLAGLPATAALATGRGAVVTGVGTLLTGAGLAAGIGHLAAFFSAYGAIAQAGLPAGDEKTMIAAVEAEPLGGVLLIVFLVCYSIGPIVLTVGLRLARRVAVWVPIAAILTAGADLFGGPIAGIVQLVALAAAWGAIVVAVARRDAGLRPRGA